MQKTEGLVERIDRQAFSKWRGCPLLRELDPMIWSKTRSPSADKGKEDSFQQCGAGVRIGPGLAVDAVYLRGCRCYASIYVGIIEQTVDASVQVCMKWCLDSAIVWERQLKR